MINSESAEATYACSRRTRIREDLQASYEEQRPVFDILQYFSSFCIFQIGLVQINKSYLNDLSVRLENKTRKKKSQPTDGLNGLI